MSPIPPTEYSIKFTASEFVVSVNKTFGTLHVNLSSLSCYRFRLFGTSSSSRFAIRCMERNSEANASLLQVIC